LLLAALSAAPLIGCGGPPADSGPYQGYVLLTGDTPNGFYGATQFWSATFDAGASTCPQTLGDCCFYPAGTGDDLPQSTANPGPVTIEDDGHVVGAIPSGVGSTQLQSGPMPAWSPGDTLVVSAPAAQVGAFSASVVAPAKVAFVQGAPADPLDRAKDWTLSWTPDATRGETVTLSLVTHRQGAGALACTVPDAAGKLTVPAAALSQLPSTAGATGPATVSMMRQAEVMTSAANAPVVTVAVGASEAYEVGLQ
jgi:hypothetical protein